METYNNHQINKNKTFKRAYLSFMAGAVVVGGLMFASDKMNLFTDNGTAAMAASSQVGTGQLTGLNPADGKAANAVLGLGGSGDISTIAEQASTAVVKIETKTKAKTGGSAYDNPLFRQFFGGGSGQGQQGGNGGSQELQPGGMGTGFIFEKSGYILTNEHVVNGADEITVTVPGYDQPFKAKLLGSSYDLDLAVLKIENDKELSYLPLGDPNSVKAGDWVVAIGNPYGFDNTVTVGVLSAKERPITIPDSQGTREYQHLLQTDASINPGNSGGPLLNMNGEVIGINTAIDAEAQGIGFAIPTSTISSVLENLKNNIAIPKEPVSYVGIVLQDIDQGWVTDLKLNNTDGALIADVDRKSPGFTAGLRPYDVVTAINGQKVTNTKELADAIKKQEVGSKITLNVIRDGQKMDVTVTIGNKNAQEPAKQ
jgi:serine protease Do